MLRNGKETYFYSLNVDLDTNITYIMYFLAIQGSDDWYSQQKMIEKVRSSFVGTQYDTTTDHASVPAQQICLWQRENTDYYL